MNFLFVNNDYYKKMLELQERLRKSEEERIRLEERFSLIEQESRMRHEACINKLRMRYIEFLEEQRLRDVRNHKLLGALDKVDANLALMSAKTDKLHSLKREYLNFIVQSQTNRRQASSIGGDSGIISQTGDGLCRKDTQNSIQIIPASMCDHPSTTTKTVRSVSEYRLFDSSSAPKITLSPAQPILPKSQLFGQTYLEDRLSAFNLNNRPTNNYNYKPKFEMRHSSDYAWDDKYRKIDYDKSRGNQPDLQSNLFAKHSSVIPYLDTQGEHTTKLTDLLSAASNIPGIKRGMYAGNTVENELERCINKIQSLHNNQNQSIEELDFEQNTSGDLLNVSLSDDGFDHLPAEDKKIEIEADKYEPNLHDGPIDPKHQESLTVLKSINPLALAQEASHDPIIKSDIATPAAELERIVENTKTIEQSSCGNTEYVEIGVIQTKSNQENLSQNDNVLNVTIDANNSQANAFDKQMSINDYAIADEQVFDSNNLAQKVNEVFIDESSILNNSKNSESQGELIYENNEEKIVSDKMSSAKLNVDSNKTPINDADFLESASENKIIQDKLNGKNHQEQSDDQTAFDSNEITAPENGNQEYTYDQQERIYVEDQDQYKYDQNQDQNYPYNDQPYVEYIDPNDSNAKQYQQPVNDQQYEQTDLREFADPASIQQYDSAGIQQYDPANDQQYQDPNQSYQYPNQQYDLQGNEAHYSEYSENPDQQAYMQLEQLDYMQDPNAQYDTDAYKYYDQNQEYFDNATYENNPEYAADAVNVNQTQAEQVSHQLEVGDAVKDIHGNELLSDNEMIENNQPENESKIDFSENENSYTNNNNNQNNENKVNVRESDNTDSTIEVNTSNTESDFNFN